MKFIASFFSKLFITYVNRIMEALGGYPESVLGRTLLAPLDRVKVLLQCQPALIQQGRLTESYKGFYDCVSKTTENEGVLSLWRGNLLTIIRYFPTQAFNFAFKDIIKSMFKQSKDDPYILSFTKIILSGSISGALTLAFMYPNL